MRNIGVDLDSRLGVGTHIARFTDKPIKPSLYVLAFIGSQKENTTFSV